MNVLTRLFRRTQPAGEPAVHPVGPTRLGWPHDPSVPAKLRKAWREDGFVVLPGVFSPEQMRAYSAVVDQVRREVDDGKDEQGYGDRIGQLHQKHPELLELASAPQVVSFLKWSFGDDPVVFGSLNFEKGTQQAAHIDAIFFWPEPSYSMAGVWIALEDVHPDAGPLFYVRGSHRWPFSRSEHVAASRPELAARRANAGALSDAERGALVGEIGSAWHADFERQKVDRDAGSETLPIRAGDVVVWHSLLAHGGSVRKDVTRSRKSVVFHYVGRRTKLYTFEQFMLLDSDALKDATPQPMNIATRDGCVPYMKYDYFVSYSGGRELVHKLG